MNRFRRLHREQTGAETVEFALLIPLVMLVAFALFPLMEYFSVSRELNRIADETAVFATRASANPERTTDPTCGDLTRRRSWAQVDDYARAGDDDIVTAVDVFVQQPDADPPSMTTASSAHPCLADPGSRIHVRVTGQFEIGAFAAAVNSLARITGADDGFIPEQATLVAVSAAYLE